MRLRAWKALFLLIIALCLTTSALAQSDNRIVKIEVVGNRIATKSLILGVAGLDLGSPLTGTDVQEAIKRLYSLNIFRDVYITAKEVTGGLDISIVVDELPKLSGLEIVGNKEIDTRDIKERLGLGVGGYISPYLVYQKKQDIKDLYGEKGYFQVGVTPILEYNADSTAATLTYEIEERSKVKVEKVVLAGTEQLNPDDLIGKMRNRKRGFLRSSDFAQDKYDEDLRKVIDEAHKKGFIDAYLISDSIAIDSVRNRMTIYLDMYEGPRYYFGDVTFEGEDVLPVKFLRNRLKFNEGEIFDAEKYDESLIELYTAYQEVGHLHARILDEKKTRADSIIDITYEINEGLPSHVRMVKILGNTKTKDHIIRREISMLPGMVFNRALLIRSIRDVMALNYFGNVEPVPVDLPSGDVDLEFRVEEKQTGQVSAGAGYNSQDKLVGSLGMGIPNFRGNGQNLSFNIDFGSRRNSFSVSFTEPWLMGYPTLFGTDLYSINRRWFDDYTEARQGGSVRLGRRLRWPDNYFRVIGSYRLERTRYNDFDDNFRVSNSYLTVHQYNYTRIDSTGTDTTQVSDRILNVGEPYPGSILRFNEEWKAASRVSLSIIRDSRNLPEFATSGSRFSYTFENTGGVIGGYWDYRKHEMEFAKFFPIWGNLALAAKVQVGGIWAPNDDKILLSDRFTPGGTAYDGIIRGYDDGSLTPDTILTDIDSVYFYSSEPPATGGPDVSQADSLVIDTSLYDTRVRGNYMFVTNWELQFPILPQQLYLLAFFDAGNSWLTWEDFTDFNTWKVYKSVGFGFRLAVPGIGTIGFDFGYPLDSRVDNLVTGELAPKKWKPHFQIGTTFR